jgi:poly(A) polymerase
MAAAAVTPDWLDSAEVRQVSGAFDAAGVPICFVGGCMRDAVISKPPGDFDIVVASPIAETQQILRRAGLVSTIPDMRIKIARAIVGGRQFDFMHTFHSHSRHPFEIRVFRYVQHFDFTLNALCLFHPVRFRDPFGGMADIAGGRVRFMEHALARIRREHRALIRYFRLTAWFGGGEPDAASLGACVEHAPELLRLPHEFICSEMIKLLSAPCPTRALALMHEHDILRYALGFQINDVALMEDMMRVEALCGVAASWRARLALLLLSTRVPPETALDHLTAFWKCDVAVRNQLAMLLNYFVAVNPDALKCAELGASVTADTLRDLLLIRWSLEDDPEKLKERYLSVIPAVAGDSLY